MVFLSVLAPVFCCQFGFAAGCLRFGGLWLVVWCLVRSLLLFLWCCCLAAVSGFGGGSARRFQVAVGGVGGGSARGLQVVLQLVFAAWVAGVVLAFCVPLPVLVLSVRLAVLGFCPCWCSPGFGRGLVVSLGLSPLLRLALLGALRLPVLVTSLSEKKRLLRSASDGAVCDFD